MTRVAILIALLCGLSACGTTREPPKVAMPAAFDGAGAGASLAPAELDRWWLLFKDPQLNALEDQAFRLSPDERTAASRILEARAVETSAIEHTFPTGGAQGNLSRQTATGIGAGSSDDLFPVGGVTTSRTLNFTPSWELDLFGRLAQQRKIAKANYAAARFEIEGTRASLAASVADNYFLARGLAIQLADAKENAQIQGELESVATQKAQIGLGAATDADRVAGDLSQANAQVESLAAQLHAAQRQLLILVGRPFEPTANAQPWQMPAGSAIRRSAVPCGRARRFACAAPPTMREVRRGRFGSRCRYGMCWRHFQRSSRPLPSLPGLAFQCCAPGPALASSTRLATLFVQQQTTSPLMVDRRRRDRAGARHPAAAFRRPGRGRPHRAGRHRL